MLQKIRGNRVSPAALTLIQHFGDCNLSYSLYSVSALCVLSMCPVLKYSIA